MGEKSAIDRVDEPVTVSSIAADLRELGLREGDVVLVHSSLRAIGWVSGGAQAVVEALLDVVTESDTLVVPTHTGQYSDPARWSNPPVPDDVVSDEFRDPPKFAKPLTGMRPAVATNRGLPSYRPIRL